LEKVKNVIAEPVELVTVRVWLTGAPPNCAEKLRLLLSTATFCAWRFAAPAAIKIVIRLYRERIRFKVKPPRGVGQSGRAERSNAVLSCTAGSIT
jgi:hypothetical protein